MFRLLKFLERKVRANYTFWDIGLLKTYGAIPGLILGAYFPEFVFKYMPLFITLFLILLMRYLYLLGKKVDRKEEQITC